MTAADAITTIYHGDTHSTLTHLLEWEPKSVTLAYLDPPFMTQRVHRTRSGAVAFTDKWPSLSVYLDSVTTAAARAWALLDPCGSLLLHVDPSVSHYLKVRLDECLGRSNFASEIVWRYRRWPARTRNFQRVHDVLLRYVVDPKRARWNQLYEPLSASTTSRWRGLRQRARTGDGRRCSSADACASAGTPIGDVWDISVLGAGARERTGYPTQKPEALLERLVLALTDCGDTVLEPYAGSGTALAVAARLGRNGIGIDNSAIAIKTICARIPGAVLIEER